MTTIPQSSEMLPRLRSALTIFTSSSLPFQILHTISLHPTPPPSKTLHILDSSFNPPTLAHRTLCLRSLCSPPSQPSTLLLLLATKNADKPPAPADFAERVYMMCLLASSLAADPSIPSSLIEIQIGVTKHARFVDKSEALHEALGKGEGATGEQEEKEQVWLTGYDTVIRLLDKKYYPEGIDELGKFFENARVRVMVRGGEGDVEGQREWVRGLREGKVEGVRRSWGERVEVLEGEEEEMGEVSSTVVRRYVREGYWEGVERLAGMSVAGFVKEAELYR